MKFTVETVKRKNRLGLKSADFYLVAVLLIITAGLLAWIQFGVKKQGETVVIKVDGNVVKQLALKNDTEFDVSGYQGGMNHIVIQDNAVYMSDADCPDKAIFTIQSIENEKKKEKQEYRKNEKNRTGRYFNGACNDIFIYRVPDTDSAAGSGREAGNCQYCHYIGIVSAWKRTGTACQSAADYADGGVIW